MRNILIFFFSHYKCRDVQQSIFSSRKSPKHTLTKHVSNNVSFKITVWKRRVYIRHAFTLNMKPVFPVGISEIMIVIKY